MSEGSIRHSRREATFYEKEDIADVLEQTTSSWKQTRQRGRICEKVMAHLQETRWELIIKITVGINGFIVNVSR